MPDDGTRYELIEGELLMAPAPNRYHQHILANLFLILGNYIRKRRLGRYQRGCPDLVHALLGEKDRGALPAARLHVLGTQN